MLKREGFEVGRRHVTTLMRRMGIEAIYRKPSTSAAPDTPDLPLLAARTRDRRANQVWATDITYIPMAAALSTWWRSSTLQPRVLRTGIDQHDPSTSASKRSRRRSPSTAARDLQHRPGQPIHGRGVHRGAEGPHTISMDGKGRWIDNVFVERLWRASNTSTSTCTPTRASPKPGSN